MKLHAVVRRPTRVAAPFVILAVAIAVACVDHDTLTGIAESRSRSARQSDYAGNVISGLHVRSELRLRINNGFRSFVTTRSDSLPVLHFPRPNDATVTSGMYSGETIRHFTQVNGTTVSIAFTRDPRTGVPRNIRVFENGELRYTVRPTYARYGSGWVRQSSDVSLFNENGDSTVVVHSESVGEAAAVVAPADVLRRLAIAFLPAELQAESPACTSAKINYSIASLALAAASTAVMAAATECGTTVLSCPAMGTAMLAFNTALGNWNAALDKMIAACASDGGSDTASGKTYK